LPDRLWASAVGRAAGAQSDNAPLLGLVVMAVLLPGGIALLLWFYRHRHRSVEQRRERFAEQFDGRPMVFFNTYQWAISEDEARQIAGSHSYREIDSAYHGRIRWLRFMPGPSR